MSIQFQNHTWTSTATLYPPGLYTPGSLDGATDVVLSPVTGYANHNLSFNQVGRYFLKFEVVSDPRDYDLWVESVAIDVEDVTVAQAYAESVRQVSLTLDYDYATYVSGEETYFMVAIANTLRAAYGNVSFGDFSVSEGGWNYHKIIYGRQRRPSQHTATRIGNVFCKYFSVRRS